MEILCRRNLGYKTLLVISYQVEYKGFFDVRVNVWVVSFKRTCACWAVCKPSATRPYLIRQMGELEPCVPYLCTW